MCKEYNGYPNYETWNIALWIDNDEGLYDSFRDLASDLKEQSAHPRSKLADAIKDYVEENNPLIDRADMYSDLLGAAIGTADFYFIADNFLEE